MTPALILTMMLGAAPAAAPENPKESREVADRPTEKLSPKVRRVSVETRQLPAAADKSRPGDVAWSLRYHPLILTPNADGGYRIIHGKVVEHQRPAPGTDRVVPEQPE